MNISAEKKESFSVGENLYSLKQSKTDPSRIATGGKENDLKIWDINRPQSAIFKAKNVRIFFIHSICFTIF
jgi:hypothetical protein